jgi:hypothetical protein
MILDELLSQVPKTAELDEKVKRICDEIMKEESLKFKSTVEQRPKGANIFLAIELGQCDQDEFEYLTLEREFKEKYIVAHVTCPPLRRKRVWEVTEVNEKKILQFYVNILKYMKGE